ncbi:MAG TPA: methyltransferase domain-containing protein [Acidimicrobiales bacterium]|nr:methyltransferase domain-containing protein [Acidimicrobiales bacterium]
MPPRAAASAPERTKLTGERPLPGATPDSLLALHHAGYRVVAERLGPGRVLDVGCGEGFESLLLGGPGRSVVGVDRDVGALAGARRRTGDGLRLAASDATRLSLRSGCFDWVCSSHVVEHFARPQWHLAELARVLRSGGTCFVLTPNAPADFENPFHLHLFVRASLQQAMDEHFSDVWVGGLEGSPAVKEDFARRRRRAARLLRVDVLDLRHRLPHSWYVAVYSRLLPVAYRLLAGGDTGGSTGISSDDFFVTEAVDDATPVLFAIGRTARDTER